jgi:hypothetical protein
MWTLFWNVAAMPSVATISGLGRILVGLLVCVVLEIVVGCRVVVTFVLAFGARDLITASVGAVVVTDNVVAAGLFAGGFVAFSHYGVGALSVAVEHGGRW